VQIRKVESLVIEKLGKQLIILKVNGHLELPSQKVSGNNLFFEKMNLLVA